MGSGVTRSEAQGGEAEDERRVPLWLQVKTTLLAMIQNDGMQEHARLPSEHELCERFGVSRTVVREALNQLVFERIIYKLQGKGAFVAGRREDQDFIGTTSFGFTDELAGRHQHVSRRVLHQTVTQPSEKAQRMLRLAEEARVVQIDRVLSVDDVPRLLVHILIPEALVPGLDQLPLKNRSLHDTLRRQYGIHFRRAERWLDAVTATPEQAALLQVPPGTPLLAIESCSYMENDIPVEYFTAFYRTDRARLHIKIG